MALRNYRLLKGRASNLALDDDDSPHIEIRIEAAGDSHRIAVNTRSSVAPHDLLYYKQEPFAHPKLPDLARLPEGLTDLRDDHPDLALDYVHDRLIQREVMHIAPFERDGPANDLRDFIEPLVRDAIANDDGVMFYAFGEAWGPEPRTADQYFAFLPGRGIHDIHMNQGSVGSHRSTNGPRQDGALLIHLEGENRWIAIFLAFQSQSWDTDPRTGHPLRDAPPSEAAESRLKPGVSVIAAVINAVGNEAGAETVTILNRTDADLDLNGWIIRDKEGRTQPISVVVGAGETARIRLADGPNAPRLSNKGGASELVTPDGTIAHAVSYDKQDAEREGWTTVF